MLSTQAIPIFVALEPDDAAREQIWRYKHRVRKLVGDQLYLDHPPHMTLYLAAFGDAQDVLEAARLAAAGIATPELSVLGWHTFLADPLTGNNTLVMDFGQNDQSRLRSIQTQIVESLAKFRDSAATLDRIDARLASLAPAERDAADRWGFPFVGPGWHPHVTIASIRPDDWPVVARELLGTPPSLELQCPKLSVYQLVDDQPSLLKSFDFPRGTERTHSDRDQTCHATRPHEASRTSSLPTRPSVHSLKTEIVDTLWTTVDRYDWILSATVTGSFLTDDSLRAISDIDLVVIAERLNGQRFEALQREFDATLRPLLARHGLGLRINPTLGPLKFNDDETAVLHLMLYSREAHHQHAIKSPFTCLDWQRSLTFRKQNMAEIYPVFGLQPHHFVSARRGIRDYLHDFERGVVSYRALECSADRCDESRREEPMTVRDRYEYAYHVMRFLMQNLLKLVTRRNAAPDADELLNQFFNVFPHNATHHRPLYLELRERKKARDFGRPLEHLADRLCTFVLDFESQFRLAFIDTATRHIVFRHAPTSLNGGHGEERRFVGRSDPSIEPLADEKLAELIEAVVDFSVQTAYVSPLRRCRQTLEALSRHRALPAAITDRRLIEQDYGNCDGLTIGETRQADPALFAAWQRREDPRFPGGENTADVARRLNEFAEAVWQPAAGNSIACTHNVIVRCLVGEALGVPRGDWHRIRVPHMAPITIVQTHQFGWFVDLEESVERRLFADFLYHA